MSDDRLIRFTIVDDEVYVNLNDWARHVETLERVTRMMGGFTRLGKWLRKRGEQERRYVEVRQ